MPQRITNTGIACTISLGGGVILRGNQWTVKPPHVTPNDATTQGATYRAATPSQSKTVEVYYIKVGTAVRFAAPTPYTYPVGTNDCTLPPTVPWQTANEGLIEDGRPDMGLPTGGTYNWRAFGSHMSEDSLYMLLVRPVGASARPGVCGYHGGGNVINSILGPQHQPHTLAAHKGMVCGFGAYRLSTFGHLPYSAFAVSGEPSVAYLDQKLSLQWMNTNAAAIGLDLSKLAISGTSAGGAAVLQLLADDSAQSLFARFWCGSGGGTGNYPTATYYDDRANRAAYVATALAPILSSNNPAYRTVADMGGTTAQKMQQGLRPEHVQGFADVARIVTPSSVTAAINGTGDLVATNRTEPENVYPFRRGVYANAIDAAKAGKIRKPGVIMYAECEALNLLGSDYVSIRTTLLALSTATLDGWAQRLGYADYTAWKAGAWQPVGGLMSLSSAQFKTSVDALAVDCENRRVLYTHAVFGYPAWRMARAATSTGSATVWLMLNNFSANSTWAGHSQEVPLLFGNPSWVVAGLADFPSATPPGTYANNRMDGLYASEIMMQMLAGLAATGDPEGSYSYAGFDLFVSNPPADGGSLSLTSLTAHTLSQPYHHNVLGKWFDPLDNLNAGTFGAGGSITAGLDIQRDARLHYQLYMNAAYAEYLGLLEP
jgi:carboxylesterase type B